MNDRIVPVSEPSSRTGRSTHPRRGGVILVAVIAIAVIGLGVAVVVVWPNSASGGAMSNDPSWYQASRRSFDLVIIAKGELDSDRKIELKSEVEGNTRIIEIVEEGTAVEAGDQLVVMAQDALQERIEQEQLNVERAMAEMVAAEQSLAIKRNEADSDLKAAQLKLDLAGLDLARWEQGSDPQEIRSLDRAVEKSRRTLEQSRRDLALSEQLFEERFISLNELDQDRIDLLEAENAIRTAELNKRVYHEFTRPKEERQFRSDVEQAEAELARTIRRNESELEQREADLRSKIRTLRIREDRLNKLNEQLEATVIRAPQAGLVVYATSVGAQRRWQQPIAAGRDVRFNETIIVLPDTRQMVAVLNVPEALVGQIRQGQRVTITVDAMPGEPVTGTVTNVGVMASSGNWMNPDLREYTIRVTLPPGDADQFKPGMRVNGQLLTGRVENSLAVPVQAVFSEGDVHFVYVPASGSEVRRQTVNLGRANESFVEVLEGLTEGDRVLLRRPRPNELTAEEREALRRQREQTDSGQVDPAADEEAPIAAPASSGAAELGAQPSQGSGQRQRPQ